MTEISFAELGKFISAFEAAKLVKNDMKIGLGTGSTAAWLVKILAEHQRNGLRFSACATSRQTTELAQSLGIDIQSLDALGQLDIAIDGADEFDPALNLIKGGGGALLQEKIVETAADRLVIITDASKEVETLGAFDLPIEVVKFGWETTHRLILDALDTLGYSARSLARRGAQMPFITDEGHYILDAKLRSITDVGALSDKLLAIPGVVETGLFIDLADEVIMGNGAGSVKRKTPNGEWSESAFDLSQYQDLIDKIWKA